jgi:polysaccharide pyruvyl transferase WcaK-like protein
MKQKRIVIIGGFGWQDIGDEAMPQAVIYNLRNKISNLDIVMLSPNPSYTSTYHKKQSIQDINTYLHKKLRIFSILMSRRLGILGKIIRKCYPSDLEYFLRWMYFLIAAKCRKHKVYLPIDKTAKAILDELSGADLLFNNGGGNINTLLYGELYKQTLTILAASFMGVPIILSGQTIGPVTKKLHAFVVKWALNNVDIITLRDRDISAERLMEIGVRRPVIKDTADDAIGLPVLRKEEAIRLIIDNGGYEWFNLPANIVAVINMNGYLKAMGKNSIEDLHKEVSLLSRVADKLVDIHDAKILLVPTDYNLASDDRPLLFLIKEGMQHSKKALVIDREYDAIQYKTLISLGDLAIGVRYHFVVFATSMGVPCIGLANGVYQKTKLKGIMQLYGLPECFIDEDMEKVGFDAVWSIVEKVVKNRVQISDQLRQRTTFLHEEAMITITRAASILSAKQHRGK